MKIIKVLQTAVESILNNKARSFLTAFGVSVGVCSVFLMLSFGAGVRLVLNKSLGSIGENQLTVRGSELSMTDRNLNYLKKHQDIMGIEKIAVAADVYPAKTLEFANPNIPSPNSGQVNVYPNLKGVDGEYLSMQKYEVVKGIGLTDYSIEKKARTVAIGSGIVSAYFKDIDPIGQYIILNDEYFRITSIVNLEGRDTYSYENSLIFLPISTALKVNSQPMGDYSEIVIRPKDPKELDRLSAEVTSYFNAVRPKEQGYFGSIVYVENPKEFQKVFLAFNLGFTAFLLTVGGISLFVSGIGIMNTMLASVADRTNEIGLRMAIGATGMDILTQFLCESLVLTMLGCYIGVVFGTFFVDVVNIILVGPMYDTWSKSLSGFVMIVDSPVLIAITLISAFTGIVCGLYPAFRASRLNPIEALRYA